ncbi:uncharacterized protein [Palaemon carinicauda]|uniref:uncharacterized protein n=1 Tax=Palaemon carinicauda TaxID=392227 RepID=UPI0035B62DC0
MAHKQALEALNATLQDLRNNKFQMVAVTVLLAGDFQQTLPVIPRSTIADELNACLKASFLWSVKALTLTTNMRIQLSDWICERAIQATKKASVANLNLQVLRLVPDNEKSYDPSKIVNYPTEFLNSLDSPGCPPHVLNLKVGASKFHLRNLDSPKLCNRMRLIIKILHSNFFEAMILTEC